MTRMSKKKSERFFAEEAAKHLGKSWDLGADRERPDFIITEGTEKFGLEVSEVFAGRTGRSGSIRKLAESENQRAINSLRKKYETSVDTPLRVQLVGTLSAGNIESILLRLIAEDFPSKPIQHHIVIDTDNGLRAHVTKALRSDWFSVNDRVGWVTHAPNNEIANAIKAKSSDLSEYRAAAGDDVRLLLVANRFNNSGKLLLEQPTAFDLNGFRMVYFFSYPENVVILENIDSADRNCCG